MRNHEISPKILPPFKEQSCYNSSAKNCKFWTRKDLTHILHSGNILYNSTGKSTTLLVSELLQYIKLYNFIYKVEEKNSIIGDIFEKKRSI